jgi:ABC-type sugar transport system ATPase subunit
MGMLRLHEISKSFPGVQALDSVSFEVGSTEIHGLVGENGAGKSTLVKIVAGAQAPDSGRIEFDGKVAQWSSPGAAKRQGVHVVYQEFVLFKHLSVAENIFVGQEPRTRLGLVDHAKARDDARQLLARFDVNIDPRTKAGSLSVADQQMVEIARALVRKVKLLILDEPTAVMSGREAELLFDRVRRFRENGVSVIFISHRLEEVFALCDRVTVLKDGRYVATTSVAELTRPRLISMMVGRELGGLFPPKRRATRSDAVSLRTERLSIDNRVRDVSLECRAGEVTALAGMVGSGRSELALGIFGALPITGGAIVVDGKRITSTSPQKSISLGIGLVPEDRKNQGLAMLLDIAANVTAPALPEVTKAGLIDRSLERSIAVEEISRYRIASRGPQTPIDTMSGGNQQKVLVARWARKCRTLLMLDEPTRGVDVGAKAEIYRIIRTLADSGVAILIISSELAEVIGLADRAYVMREGQITGELDGSELSEERLMNLATIGKAA